MRVASRNYWALGISTFVLAVNCGGRSASEDEDGPWSGSQGGSAGSATSSGGAGAGRSTGGSPTGPGHAGEGSIGSGHAGEDSISGGGDAGEDSMSGGADSGGGSGASTGIGGHGGESGSSSGDGGESGSYGSDGEGGDGASTGSGGEDSSGGAAAGGSAATGGSAGDGGSAGAGACLGGADSSGEGGNDGEADAPVESWPVGPCLAVGLVDPSYSNEWPAPESPPSPLTIDKLTMRPWYEDTYSNGKMWIGAFGDEYFLSNGSSWDSGAGSAIMGYMSLDHVTVKGCKIEYHMAVDQLMIERTDYDGGQHSAHFRFETLGSWTIVAEYGSSEATLSADVLITMNEPANYVDSRFNYLSKPLCSAVPVSIHYSLLGKVFDEHLFDQSFQYIAEIEIDLSTAP